MFSYTLFLISFCVLTIVESKEELPTLVDTAFGEATFLPEIVPLNVQRSLSENGDLIITIDVLYSEDSVVTWVAHGPQRSYIDRIYLRVGNAVPGEYTLVVTIPREVLQVGDTLRDDDDDAADEVFKLEDNDFLVDQKELYIKFQTVNTPEGAVMKLSLDNQSAEDRNEDNITSVDKEFSIINVMDEDVPKFPEMQELDQETINVTPGTRTQVSFSILITENDRYSVRGLLYNSSSNRIITTFWSTDYSLGASDFRKIPNENDEDSENVDDDVRIADNSESQELSSIRDVLIEIPTEHDDISGIYTIRAHHETDLGEPGFILESCLEQSFIVQRTDQEHGPIPPGVLEFEGGSYSQVSCRVGLSCLVTCRVFGVGVQSLQLKHKNLQSEFVKLPGNNVDYGLYELTVFVLPDSTNPADSGTYICEANNGLLSISKEIDLNFVQT